MSKHDSDDWRDSPTAWFSLLESALRDGDIERAAEAVRELRRLGIEVTLAPGLLLGRGAR